MNVKPNGVQESPFAGLVSQALHRKTSTFDAICLLAKQIFMLIKHDVVGGILKLHKWVNETSPFMPQHITVPTKNIANLPALQWCIESAASSVSRHSVKRIGKAEGLKIAQDMTVSPIGGSRGAGLCFGMSVAFLAPLAVKANSIADVKASGEKLREGATVSSVAVQTLYDAIMPKRVPVNQLIDWKKLLDDPKHEPNVNMGDVQKKQLLGSLRKFFEESNKDTEKQSLRKFVLDDMENAKVDIDSDVYAIILELDAEHHARQSNIPINRIHDGVHIAIQQTVLNEFGLKIDKADIFGGKKGEGIAKLSNLPAGTYLIGFPHHATAFVKTADGKSAFFDPVGGTAIMQSPKEESEVLDHLLQHYFPSNNVSFSILALRS